MASLKDAIDYDGVRDRLRHQKPMQFVPALEVASGGLEKYGFKTLREFVTAHTADGGLGVPLEKAKWLIEFNPAYKHQAKELIAMLGIAELAKVTEAVKQHGGDRGQDAVSENGNLKHGSNKATYRIAKLKRDHPEVAKRLELGEFKTVSQAERAAGVRQSLRPKARLTLPLDDAAEAVAMFNEWMKNNYKNY